MKTSVALFISYFFIFAMQAQTSVADGTWAAGSTWGGSSPGFTGLTSPTVDSYVIANSGLTFSNANGNSLTITDTLIVYGDIIFSSTKNNASITVGAGNVLIVFGSVELGKNNAGIDVAAGGVAVVTGAIVAVGNNGTISGSGTVYTPSTDLDDTGIGEGAVQPIDNLDGDSFGEIEEFVTGGGDTPLPVELMYFTATNDGEINLSWATATEINNDYFVVERSEDGAYFYEIGRIKGNGNSTNLNSYNFVDKFPFAEVAYYRLTQFDYDGQSETFQIVRVETDLESNNNKLTVYPTIVSSGSFTIKSTKPYQIKQLNIYSLDGKVHRNLTQDSVQENPLTYQSSSSGLPAGDYVVDITTSTGEKHASRIKIR